MPINPLLHLEIEHGFELPPNVIAPRIPWEKMEEGDSVFLEKARYQVTMDTLLKQAGNANIRYHDQGKRFCSCRAEKDGKLGVRIWRVDPKDGFLSIEKDVAIPSPALVDLIPWDSMEVGESVFIDCEKYNIKPRNVQLRSSAKSRALKPKSFSAHKVEEDGAKGVRIWRVT